MEILGKDELFGWIAKKYGVLPEYLWEKFPSYAVFRHQKTRKWFAVFMSVPKSKLGLPGGERAEILNIKCGPLLMGSLRGKKGFLPAYHMNKDHWVSVLLDSGVSSEEILGLLELSFDLTSKK